MSEVAVQITEKRRKGGNVPLYIQLGMSFLAKGKGERERYTQLNVEFKRIAKRDTKAFLSKQCKEIEENNRMGKTRALFKKIGDTKGTFQARIGMMNGRNCKDLAEAEEIKKRWQEYTELYRKHLNDPDNNDCVITYLESDILECEVKFAFGNIMTDKASGGDGIPTELFQILLGSFRCIF